ncbi:MAG: serine--tRNA ligase, partial [Thermoplasmata archaeon]
MLDPKLIRDNPELVRQAMRNRGFDLEPLEKFIELDNRWRALVDESNRLKARRNQCAQDVPKLSKDEREKVIAEMRQIGDRIQQLEGEQRAIEVQRDEILQNIPNIPHPSVPVGSSDADNVIVRYWGEQRKFDFKPLPHWELGERLDIIDFERGTKIAASGFYVLKGMGARLERALINFMLDLH